MNSDRPVHDRRPPSSSSVFDRPGSLRSASRIPGGQRDEQPLGTNFLRLLPALGRLGNLKGKISCGFDAEHSEKRKTVQNLEKHARRGQLY